MPRITFLSPNSPDYSSLVKFLITPFLESPDSLSVDWEEAKQNQRIWIRLAVGNEDKGKVYGRGGRNLQAMRTVLETAANSVGKSVYLDFYESQSLLEEEQSDQRTSSNAPPIRKQEQHPRRKPRTRRPLNPRF